MTDKRPKKYLWYCECGHATFEAHKAAQKADRERKRQGNDSSENQDASNG